MQSHAPLSGKRAIIHGGAGAIGRAIAEVFARDGAHVFLTGRSLARVEAVAAELRVTGGQADAARVDVLDEASVDAHAAEVGALDIVVNAFAIEHVQGVPLAELSLEQYMQPILGYTRGNFLAVRAAARYLRPRGAVLLLSPPGARLVGRGWLGHGVAFAGVEQLTRLLAAELGPQGVRVLCLCPHAIPEAVARSHARDVFQRRAEADGTTIEAMLEGAAKHSTLLGRLPTLAEVAETAAFVASDRAGAMTATTVNLSCGALPE
jgi:NAD(P)-dependent dehydrogenase (short-subunit alcohol dehydrogenase family)